MVLIFSTENSSALHLACEEILLKGNDELIFLYINEPSVILGANQNWEFEVNREYCEQNNIQIRRRISGGGTVYHDRGNINYCFIGEKTVDSLSDSFLDPIIVSLSKMGIEVEKGLRKDLWINYNINKYKISGTASHISKNRRLQHGTLLFDSNLEFLEKSSSVNKIGKTTVPSVRSEVINLRQTMKDSTNNTERFFSEFVNSFKKILDINKTYRLEDYIRLHTDQFSGLSKLIEKHKSESHIFRR